MTTSDSVVTIMCNVRVPEKTALRTAVFVGVLLGGMFSGRLASCQQYRAQPDAMAARCGSAINWNTDIEAAFELSRRTGKPLFWYVPRLPGTFMDRVQSIDMYIKAGMFSWPRVVHLINERFVPLMAIPDPEHQQQFRIVKYEFIEPGILVVNSGGNVDWKWQAIRTQHIPWIERAIAEVAGVPIPARPRSLELIWKAFSDGSFDTVRDRSTQFVGVNANADAALHIDDIVEAMMLSAMASARSGRMADARKQFRDIVSTTADHPLAWKAAAELQEIGPFVRGFEVASTIPESAYDLKRMAESGTLMVTYTAGELCDRGIDFLLSMQRPSGAFVDSDYDFGGADSLGNVHVAVTSICGMALLGEQNRIKRLIDRNFSLKNQSNAISQHLKRRAAQVDLAIEGCLKFVSDDRNLNFSDHDELAWSLAYRLDFTSRHAGRPTPTAGAVDPVLEQLSSLLKCQNRNGSWHHEYENPFVTATAMLALVQAQQLLRQKNKADDTVTNRCVKTLDAINRALTKGAEVLGRRRSAQGLFPYDYSRGSENQTVPRAAAGRTALCEAALFATKHSNPKMLADAIAQSDRHQPDLERAYGYDDHTDHFVYGGFFYWYDMFGKRQAINMLPDSPQRNQMEERLRAAVIRRPEIDGAFCDSHELGRCYGTAMALLTLGQ